MTSRPSELAKRISNHRDPDSGFSRETFTLPVEAARLKAREILSQFPRGGYSAVTRQSLNNGSSYLTGKLNSRCGVCGQQIEPMTSDES